HLGNVRAALFNWLVARHDDGRFLLRIEDTDVAREVPGGADAIVSDLQWLGLSADEEAVYQSRRADTHAAALARLQAAGRLYPCFCSEATLKRARIAQQEAGRPPRYSGTCAAVTQEDAERRRAAGEPHTLRFRVPPDREVAFEDRVHGPQRFATADIGDFVVQRSDGTPAFFFANALDDGDAGVTLVLRGDDHLSNSPRQILLLEALDLPVPEYGHLPLIHGAGGGRLSKRSGALSVANLRDSGYHPLAIVNYLARVGGHVESQAALPLTELARAFDVRNFAKSPAGFDEDQLRYWQRHALDSLSSDALWEWMDEAVHARVPGSQRDAFLSLVRPNVLFPGDALDWTFVLFDDDPMPQKEALATLQQADPALFTHALRALEGARDWPALVATVRDAAGVRGPQLFKPLRAALTGRMDGPDLAGVFALLTPERIRTRLERAVSLGAG
ncbi:MAG: glutamate--tRNA ligase, partial [Xanthomonadaceae bacterium]|nr:glutamate--tRNA ligase [Xanthomonadaceae bacterium]